MSTPASNFRRLSVVAAATFALGYMVSGSTAQSIYNPPIYANINPSSVDPLGNAVTAAPGSSTDYSRADHVHPIVPPPVGSPNSRTISLATAYQATNTAKPAMVTVNLSSTAALSLSGGTTNTADVVIGSTNGVASGTGTAICKYANTNTGALTIGLNLSTVMGSTCSFILPPGWYFATRQTAGTVTITSTFDQPIG